MKALLHVYRKNQTMNKFLAVLVFFAIHAVGYSQPTSTDQQLANLYYNNGEYEKAIPYFEKILSNKNSVKFDQLRYVECLEKTDQKKDAERVLKKYAAANSKDLDYQILLGDFYARNERPADEEKLLNGLIKDNSQIGYQVIELYNAFLKRGKTEWALKTLEAGRKNLKKNFPLYLQFAEIYGVMGRTDDMITEYFKALDEYPTYANQIQTDLTNQIDFTDENNDVYQKLKAQLLTRIQKDPNEVIYPQMLIWLFTQRKEFKSAMVQAQALDKRQGNTGAIVMDLSDVCVVNNEYNVARSGYQYVIGLGTDKPNYYNAYVALLNVQYREITIDKKGTPESIASAVKDYRFAIKNLTSGRKSVNVTKELATIEAYYNNHAEIAQHLLDSCLAIPGLTDMEKAEVKMLLADILVLEGDIWQASLYYMQIDTDFKFETIGSEAKFKNARVFYYDGDFKFAQSQLDVLKQSTSKLIANDAMKLSVLITDNLGLDSNYTAMYRFAQADLLLQQHQYTQAFQEFDSIQREFPDHGLADEILMRKAQAMQEQGKWEEAVSYLEKIVQYHFDDILADDAVFQLGDIYENHLNNKEKAAEYYKKILFECKGSLLTVEARKRFRALRGDKAAEEEL